MASCLGLFLALGISFILLLGFIGALIAGATGEKEPVEVAEHSILKLSFNRPIVDLESNSRLSGIDLGPLSRENSMGLRQITNAIRHAKTDPKIKVLYLDFSLTGQYPGMASLQELKAAIDDFKQSKKQVITYGSIYTKKETFLSANADRIILHPKGNYILQGMSSNGMFYKGLLDKLDIQVELIKRGNYKGAGEVFTRENYSDFNREQVQSFLGNIYQVYLKDISVNRKISSDSLHQWANNLHISNPHLAQKVGLVTDLMYQDEVDSLMEKLSGGSKDDLVEMADYVQLVDQKEKNKGDEIAVIYAEGEIISGKNSGGYLGDETLVKAIREARDNDRIKAVVLRVNSPGGSALASDVMERELQLLKKQKTLVVSMGDVAASGGYMIAAPGDRIFAEPTTITGSIGVFATVPYTGNFMKNKLGITFDRVSTAPNSDIGNINQPLTPAQRQWFQHSVNQTYDEFVGMVAQNRRINISKAYQIAEGRVYSGVEAKKIGLIDEFGGLQQAIEYAAKKSGTADYHVVAFPELPDALTEFLADLSGTAKLYMKGPDYWAIERIQAMFKTPIQTRMPIDYTVE